MREKDAKRAIALGFFDGVHCGHQALMNMAVRRAKENGAISSVFTFDTHPDTVIFGTPVPLITSPFTRREEIRGLGGVDEVIFAHFDEKLQKQDWKEFVDDVLVGQFHACWIITGRNNRFGYRGQGNPERLQEECARLGIGCDVIEDVKIDGVPVSSTHIRKLISEGNMEQAARFLGHPYHIAGIVQHGRRVGRTIGVPTINIPLPPQMQQPPYGVYASKVCVDGEEHVAVTNIGLRPTFDCTDAANVEAHLLDYIGDLYGKLVEVALYRFLRPEHRFEDPQQLRIAIEEDIVHTRDFFH